MAPKEGAGLETKTHVKCYTTLFLAKFTVKYCSCCFEKMENTLLLSTVFRVSQILDFSDVVLNSMTFYQKSTFEKFIDQSSQQLSPPRLPRGAPVGPVSERRRLAGAPHNALPKKRL